MKVRKRMIFLFLLPASTLYLVFFLFPAVWAFYFSVFDWSGFGESKVFIGLGNYLELMNDDLFWTSMTNTIKILFLGGFITLAVAFIMTILFSTKIRGKKFFRAMIFMPNVIATIALTTLWAFIYNPKFGLLTNFFAALGFEELSKVLWTAGDKVFYAMLIALIWIQVGFMVVLLLAGADKIPFEFYEAAKIEGANIWQMFIRIHHGLWQTGPNLSPGLRYGDWGCFAACRYCRDSRAEKSDAQRGIPILGGMYGQRRINKQYKTTSREVFFRR